MHQNFLNFIGGFESLTKAAISLGNSPVYAISPSTRGEPKMLTKTLTFDFGASEYYNELCCRGSSGGRAAD
jgi:hypothetical protein